MAVVAVDAVVSARGFIKEATVVRRIVGAPGSDELLDDYISKTVFIPAMKGGKFVEVSYRIIVRTYLVSD